MVQALWLTSWYPNKLDALNGDFIQRHARATSKFCTVHVIHLEADKQNVVTQISEVSVSKKGNLTEVIVLYKLFRHIPFAGKFFSYLRYSSLFKKYIKEYIQQHGKPDIVHVHIPMKAGLLALWIKKKYHIPYIVTEHWAIYNNKAPDAFLTRNFVFKYLTKKILKQAALFTPVSGDLGKAVKNMVINIPFTVIPNVADTTLFYYDRSSKRSNDVFVFFHASTLKYQKNPEGILRTYKQFADIYPKSKLIIAGPAENLLRQYASSLAISPSNIEFTGWLTYDEVAGKMKLFDAFVMFSRYENLPCVIIEALCCGLPVISTDTGGIKEVINNSNGILVNMEDEKALLAAMIQVYKHKAEINRSIISEKAISEFSYDVIGKKIVSAYEKVITNM